MLLWIRMVPIKELIIPNAGNTINFYQQLKALRDKEGTLDAEVGTLKKKIDDMTSDIWSKEFIDGMSADQLAPLKRSWQSWKHLCRIGSSCGERTGTVA